jgi:glycopeptide antibiotics resistance protein
MPWRTIGRYSRAAGLFGLCAAGIWLLARCLRKRRGPRGEDLSGLPAVFYLAAVIEIIGLRIGLQAFHWLSRTPNLIPLQTTLDAWRHGPGAFTYHVCGNLLWFVPLGIILARRGKHSWRHALLTGAGLSLALEALQWLLGTGMPDIDDVLLNALGALMGYSIFNRRRA